MMNYDGGNFLFWTSLLLFCTLQWICSVVGAVHIFKWFF